MGLVLINTNWFIPSNWFFFFFFLYFTLYCLWLLERIYSLSLDQRVLDSLDLSCLIMAIKSTFYYFLLCFVGYLWALLIFLISALYRSTIKFLHEKSNMSHPLYHLTVVILSLSFAMNRFSFRIANTSDF